MARVERRHTKYTIALHIFWAFTCNETTSPYGIYVCKSNHCLPSPTGSEGVCVLDVVSVSTASAVRPAAV